jgi:hypothetical protein
MEVSTALATQDMSETELNVSQHHARSILHLLSHNILIAKMVQMQLGCSGTVVANVQEMKTVC